MLAHLFNLLGRSFMFIPKALGSNWLGLVSPVFIALVGEAIGILVFGWQAMKDNWRKATGIGLAAIGAFYTVVFLGCIFMTTYVDHIDLVTKNHDLHTRIGQGETHEEKSVQAVREDLGGKLSALKENCARTDGANGILTKQAADQQNTINNCQTEALKLLLPRRKKSMC